ncbi:MAG: HisS family protein, partial [Candidatus Aenigmatarchaeota archaeon]
MTLQTPRGTRDLVPEEMEKRNRIIDIIRKTYESYGFLPLETPAFESWELLSKKGGGGDAIKDEIYYFKDKSGRELALRFDLTVPLSRFIATNPQIAKPFKRYQIGRVWRYDRPQAGRFREFEQADIDIIGSASMEADAECIAAVSDVLKSLGLKNFVIRVNNRKILNSMIKSLNLEKKAKDIFRILDKMEKAGENETTEELKKIDKNAVRI